MLAIATDSISSLFNVASSRDIHFHQPQQLQCLHHGSTKVLLCTLFLSPLLRRWQFVVFMLWLQCKTWVSAMLAGCFLCYSLLGKCSKLLKTNIVIQRNDWATHPILINNLGACPNNQRFLTFCNCWITLMKLFIGTLYAVMLCNRLKMSECKLYWLMDFTQISRWVCWERIVVVIFLLPHYSYKKTKPSNFTVDRDHSYNSILKIINFKRK